MESSELIEFVKEESVKFDSDLPGQYLEIEYRKAMWRLAVRVNLQHSGIPAHACTLLERYLAVIIFAFDSQETGDKTAFLMNLNAEMPVHIVVALVMAAKIISANSICNFNVFYDQVRAEGINIGINEVMKAEMHFLSAIGFYVPHITVLSMTEMLVSELNLSMYILKLTTCILDMAEICRPIIYQHMSTIFRANDGRAYVLKSIHLMAGSIVAALKVGHIDPSYNSTLATLLANIANTSDLYLDTLASCLVFLFKS